MMYYFSILVLLTLPQVFLIGETEENKPSSDVCKLLMKDDAICSGEIFKIGEKSFRISHMKMSRTEAGNHCKLAEDLDYEKIAVLVKNDAIAEFWLRPTRIGEDDFKFSNDKTVDDVEYHRKSDSPILRLRIRKTKNHNNQVRPVRHQLLAWTHAEDDGAFALCEGSDECTSLMKDDAICSGKSFKIGEKSFHISDTMMSRTEAGNLCELAEDLDYEKIAALVENNKVAEFWLRPTRSGIDDFKFSNEQTVNHVYQVRRTGRPNLRLKIRKIYKFPDRPQLLAWSDAEDVYDKGAFALCEEVSKCDDVDKPCSDYGTCTDGADDNTAFTCVCHDGYTGAVCDQDCEDTNTKELCDYWELQGHCDSGEWDEYMKINCAKTCKTCDVMPPIPTTVKPTTIKKDDGDDSGDCDDNVDCCGDFAKSGFCTKYQSFMNQECKKSCGKCGGPGPVTTKKPGVCKDDNTSCEAWANNGECEKNSDYMLESCKKSCQEC